MPTRGSCPSRYMMPRSLPPGVESMREAKAEYLKKGFCNECEFFGPNSCTICKIEKTWGKNKNRKFKKFCQLDKNNFFNKCPQEK